MLISSSILTSRQPQAEEEGGRGEAEEMREKRRRIKRKLFVLCLLACFK